MTDAPAANNVTNTQPLEDKTPPWGSDENFNAEKAWTLIQNLRGEIADVKNKRDAATQAAEAADKQAKDHAEQLQAAQAAAQLAADNAEKAEAERIALATQRTKENLLIDAGLPRDLADNVVGDDEDGWTASVEKLAALRGDAAPTTPPRDPAQSANNNPTADPQADAHEFFARHMNRSGFNS